jgi:hypothetical protein
MTEREPAVTLDTDYSDANATATPWADAATQLDKAEIFWLSTVRPDGRPHVTPLIVVWLDGALHFCTGAHERKARNIEQNAQVVLTTGRNSMHEDGLDVVVEGEAVRVTDGDRLGRIAAYEAKYGPDWHFDVQDGAFHGQEGNVALVFAVAPTTAFGFGKGSTFSQTRWRF